MTREAYMNIIDSFDVENNSKYQPSGRNTYCNIFAQDVAKACGTPLPTGGCEDMLKSLWGNNFPKWYSVDFQLAQERANEGESTIAITYDHVAIVRPNNDNSIPDTVGGVRNKQAGGTCYNDTTLTHGWGKDRRDEVRFYSWYESGKPEY